MTHAGARLHVADLVHAGVTAPISLGPGFAPVAVSDRASSHAASRQYMLLPLSMVALTAQPGVADLTVAPLHFL